ncbi:MAG: hypothetical protein AAFO74_03435 [Pseudomonadota bacterium]
MKFLAMLIALFTVITGCATPLIANPSVVGEMKAASIFGDRTIFYVYERQEDEWKPATDFSSDAHLPLLLKADGPCYTFLFDNVRYAVKFTHVRDAFYGMAFYGGPDCQDYQLFKADDQGISVYLLKKEREAYELYIVSAEMIGFTNPLVSNGIDQQAVLPGHGAESDVSGTNDVHTDIQSLKKSLNAAANLIENAGDSDLIETEVGPVSRDTIGPLLRISLQPASSETIRSWREREIKKEQTAKSSEKPASAAQQQTASTNKTTWRVSNSGDLWTATARASRTNVAGATRPMLTMSCRNQNWRLDIKWGASMRDVFPNGDADAAAITLIFPDGRSQKLAWQLMDDFSEARDLDSAFGALIEPTRIMMCSVFLQWCDLKSYWKVKWFIVNAAEARSFDLETKLARYGNVRATFDTSDMKQAILRLAQGCGDL